MCKVLNLMREIIYDNTYTIIHILYIITYNIHYIIYVLYVYFNTSDGCASKELHVYGRRDNLPDDT